jgi:GT2 family glycosyltransferase
MSLIAMAVHDTEDNGRTSYTDKTIESLLKTVDFDKHRLFVIDNNSCRATKDLYERLVTYWALNKFPFSHLNIIYNTENIGTAKAINLAWKQRKPGEHCVKIDNDVVIHSKGWVEEMEEAIEREPILGQVGLKRKDCWEFPEHENKEHRSKLIMLPHIAGQRWIVVEQSKHIIGTCVMHSAALIDKIGYLYQPGLYGYDDVLMSWRSNLAGFACVFLPHINIDHIDTGGTEYQGWKERHSGQYTKQVSDIVDQYISGAKSLYYEP